MTTLHDFYYALSRMTVTGVGRNYEYQPDALTTADLPALWVELPDGNAGADSGWASACRGTGKSRVGRVVVAIEAAGQDTPGPNTRAVVKMMDALEVALDALAYPFVDYSMSGSEPIVAGLTQYWGVTATVTIRG